MRNMIIGIYCIENIINNKKYIGQSKDIQQRYQSHKSKLNKHTHPNKLLQSDWDEYGEDKFIFYEIERCGRDKLNDKEIYYIKFFNTFENGYNLSPGGENGNNSSCKRIKQYDLEGNFIQYWKSAAEAARYFNIDRSIISRAIKNHKQTQGYQWCYEYENLKGFYLKKNQCCFLKMDDNKKIINVYKNMSEILKENPNYKNNNIYNSMTHKWRSTAYGYYWKKITKEEYYEYRRQGY